MKVYLFIQIISLLFIVISLPVFGSILGFDEEEIVFKEGEVPDGVSWTEKVILTDEGLDLSNPVGGGTSNLWIESQIIPIGITWRPPVGVSVTINLYGVESGDQYLSAYVRYGCDRVHWSTWYHIPGIDNVENDAMKTFQYRLNLPNSNRVRYDELMTQWRETDPVWQSDEGALCKWIATNYPDFFLTEFPFVGYLQFRLEGWISEPGNVIKSINISAVWSVGGIADIPRDEDYVKPEGKWNFDLSKAEIKDIFEE